MANKTLLNAVNETLKRVKVIQSDLASTTDSSIQTEINATIQVINEGIDELYSYAKKGMPNEQASSTLTLVLSQRDYALASDLIVLHFPLIDETNTQFIYEFPGGYDDMLLLDPEQDDTGLPYYAAINPTNGQLHLDRAPTSTEAGRVYTYQYEKDLVLSADADTVPFNNAVFRSMVPVWAQLYKRERQNEFDQPLYNAGLGRASRYLSLVEPRKSYSPR